MLDWVLQIQLGKCSIPEHTKTQTITTPVFILFITRFQAGANAIQDIFVQNLS